jgi:hypothetical protein
MQGTSNEERNPDRFQSRPSCFCFCELCSQIPRLPACRLDREPTPVKESVGLASIRIYRGGRSPLRRTPQRRHHPLLLQLQPAAWRQGDPGVHLSVSLNDSTSTGGRVRWACGRQRHLPDTRRVSVHYVRVASRAERRGGILMSKVLLSIMWPLCGAAVERRNIYPPSGRTSGP